MRPVRWVVIVSLLAAALWLWWVGPLAWFGPTSTAQRFCDDLGAGRVEEAYARTSLAYRRDHSLQHLRAFLEEHRALDTRQAPHGRAVSLAWPSGSSRVTASVSAHSPQGAVSLTMTLVQEDGEWRVDGISGD
jgi:hypothetical protein